jgi:hypothetical protein
MYDMSHWLRLMNLFMFKDLALETQKMMTKQIIKKVSYPEELLIFKGEYIKLIILQKGEVGLCACFPQFMISVITYRIKIENNYVWKLLLVGFIKLKSTICDTKCLYTQSYLFGERRYHRYPLLVQD